MPDLTPEQHRKERTPWNKGIKLPYIPNMTGLELGRVGGWKGTERASKISNKQKGKKISQEIRKKISKSHKGLLVSQETKEKVSKALKEQWKNGIRYAKRTKEDCKKYIREWRKKRKKIDPKFHLDCVMGTAIWLALKTKKKGKKWEKLVGYSIEDLMACLGTQFTKEMNWENYGKYWVVDHIKPKSLFKENGFKECWALNNLQPLEKITNIKKSNKYD